jgi:Fur family peroxide stress response transcriptional regulator
MRPVANKKTERNSERDLTVSGRHHPRAVGAESGTMEPLLERLANGGFRFTPQRQQVYEVLLQERDHPTAEEVFIRSKKVMPDISIATVYNCLTALVKCGLVRQVTLERGAARFCPNMREHCHFHCEACDEVFDLDLPEGRGIELPKGFKAERLDIAIHGRCPNCNSE